jgi:DNA-binding MarR family transcriptional regulator
MRAAVHAALGGPGRLAIVDALVLGEASPSELQQLLDMPSNLMAHHVRVLERAGVVERHRSEGDRRRTYLTLATGALDALRPSSSQDAVRVVFVCTGNSARSHLAAALWNDASPVPATSAGTHPARAVHPGTLAPATPDDRRLHCRCPIPRTGEDAAFDAAITTLADRVTRVSPALHAVPTNLGGNRAH